MYNFQGPNYVADAACASAMAAITAAVEGLAEGGDVDLINMIGPVNMAMYYYTINQDDKAIEWLEKGYKTRSGLMVYLKIYGQTFMNNIGSDPRYKELLKKMGFKT